MSGYQFRGFYIPERMMGGLRRYVDDRIEPGSFLLAVLENNLSAACGHADEENMQNLPAFAAWLCNEAPSPCHGSREKVAAWLVGVAP